MDPRRLIQAYKKSGRTLTELAAAVGVPIRYISDMRHGRHRFNGTVALRVAKELGEVGIIPKTELAQLQFQLACRNMPLGEPAPELESEPTAIAS